MATAPEPIAKAFLLCESHLAYSDGKVDLLGICNSIRPNGGYPYVRKSLCVFSQLTNGRGKVGSYIDVRFAETNELIFTTEVRELSFPDPCTTIQVVRVIQGAQFASAGLYLVELFCDNKWVCDTSLLLC